MQKAYVLIFTLKTICDFSHVKSIQFGLLDIYGEDATTFTYINTWKELTISCFLFPNSLLFLCACMHVSV